MAKRSCSPYRIALSFFRFLRLRLEGRRIVRLLRHSFFRLIWRKILFVDIDDLYFGAELAIAAEQNLVAGLLSLATITSGKFHHCSRWQQVLLFVDRDPIIVNQLAGGGDGETG